MPEFRAIAGNPADGTRYGRFGIALDRPAGMLLPRAGRSTCFAAICTNGSMLASGSFAN